MRVFIAGATGTIGYPVAKELIGHGHEVAGLTRSEGGAARLRQLGAAALIGDALDADGVARAVAEVRPTHVLHLLTAIPPNVTRPRHMAATNELRIQGTANLIRAAVAAGAQRIVAESFPTVYGIGTVASQPLSEHDRVKPLGRWASSQVVQALRSLESQMREARERGEIETVILRYGYLYGPDVPSTTAMLDGLRTRKIPVLRQDESLGSFIHHDDVTAATLAALEAPKVSDIYNVVDDVPARFTDFVTFAVAQLGAPEPRRVPRWVVRLAAPLFADIASSRLPLSNRRARGELAFTPKYPSFREGLTSLSKMAGTATAQAAAG